MTEWEAAVSTVLERNACSGCGLCTLLDDSVQMRLDPSGYLRPVFTGAARPIDGAVEIFRKGCPGVTVDAPGSDGTRRHPLLGRYVAAWEAWAADPDVRRAGSSGGALTALHGWLLESGRAVRIAGAAADATAARRSVPVTITTREQAMSAAGSRYAPVSTLTNPDVLRAGSAVTGKPCEIAALRATISDLGDERSDGEHPLMLSFFCAGTPSQHATDDLLAGLGIANGDDISSLRYRGDGWPGRFTAISGDHEVSADYDESWGSTLGPTTQWRCKICVDGVGESADIVCADSWETDERGYPTFAEGDGVSALIARTLRGRETIVAALEAGILKARPLDMAELAQAQPLQTARRRFMFARVWGSRLAGRPTPRFHGFGLIRLSLTDPRQALRVLRGTMRRVRRDREEN